MNGFPLVILSDSDALIGDIEYVFREEHDFVSSESVDWVREYISRHYVKLLIADMDIKSGVQTEILNRLRELRDGNISILFLVSEQKKLELEKSFGDLSGFDVPADWLVKPFSRNALVSTVDHLCE